MAVRVRQDGRVLCAAMHTHEPEDVYLDDGLHYRLAVELGVLVTEPMHGGGRGGHAAHGEWWWRGLAPVDASLDRFYLRPNDERSTKVSAAFEDVRVDRVKAALTDPAALAAFESLMEQLDGAMVVAEGAEYAAFLMRGEVSASERQTQETRESLPVLRAAWIEGMVTVYDHKGGYLGCLGVEQWKAQLGATPYLDLKAEIERAEDALSEVRALLWEDGTEMPTISRGIVAQAIKRIDAALSTGSASAWIHGRDRARESSAADVDGASYDAGHHESVGERQGRQPAPDPEREARIAACPTPAYHETHRYCPSCPWTEREALSAGSGGREPTPEIAWLVERGQPENQTPTVWLDDSSAYGGWYGEWTEDANRATKFASREAAEAWMEQHPESDPARATEHGFMSAGRRKPTP